MPKITVRMTSAQHERIAHAAALVGEPMSTFIVAAARSRAERILDRRDLIAAIDTHLATATRHSAGTTDRLLAADRNRPW
jgi:uncharacterized protein (DUF1778 family)